MDISPPPPTETSVIPFDQQAVSCQTILVLDQLYLLIPSRRHSCKLCHLACPWCSAFIFVTFLFGLFVRARDVQRVMVSFTNLNFSFPLSIDEKPHFLFLTLRYETSLLMGPLFRCCLHIDGVELPL